MKEFLLTSYPHVNALSGGRRSTEHHGFGTRSVALIIALPLSA
jgi:hypothetical protein